MPISRLPISKLFLVAIFGLLLCPATKVSAADPASDRAEFDKTYAQFNDLLRQCKELQGRFSVTPPAQHAELQRQFDELVHQGNEMRPKLKAQAEKVYLANPRDEEISNLMFAMIIGSMRADEYEEVLRISKILIDNNYPRDELYNLAGTAAFFTSHFDEAEKYLNAAVANKSIDEHGQELLKEIPEYREKWARELKFRAAEAKADDMPRVKLTIGDAKGHVKGDVVVELFEDSAPNTVASFVSLVDRQFYDGLKFHRVLAGFMAQVGDPKGDGSGGPGYQLPEEFSPTNHPDHRDHFRGSLSMARSQSPDSAGSQFFICFAPSRQLDDHYTVFGRVLEGMDLVTHIQRIDPDHPSPVQPDRIIKAEVIRKRPHIYSPKKLPERG